MEYEIAIFSKQTQRLESFFGSHCYIEVQQVPLLNSRNVLLFRSLHPSNASLVIVQFEKYILRWWKGVRFIYI